jgi:subtilisin family serine protease
MEQVAALAALPGVRAVYPIIAKEPANANVAGLLNTPAIWEGIDRAGLTGQGVSIAVIDTGIDYLHTMFGGPGTGHASNDTTIIGDVPGFPYHILWEERVVRSVANLTRQDGEELLAVAPAAGVRPIVQRFKLEQANQALERLRRGQIEGAAVLVME